MIGAWCLAVLLAGNGAPGQQTAQPDPSAFERHARAAQQAQRDGDFATAIREFTALSRLLPDRADVHSNLGLAYFFHNQPREALASFDAALRLNPKLVSALLFAGIAHEQLSKPSRATPLLERAVALSPADPLAHTWLAHSYAAQSRFRQAVDHYLAASERAPRDVDIWYGLGQAYLQLGREEVRQLAAVAPGGARVLQLAGDLWLLRGETRNALALYEQALKIRPGSIELQQAVARLRNRELVSQPIAADPAAAPATAEDRHYLAATDYRERARRAFGQIEALGASSHRAHQILAESLAEQERVDAALDEYRAALRLKPDIAGIRLAMGNLLMSEGRAAEALDEYRQEQRLRPEDPELHYRMGRALLVVGQEADAEAAFTRALAMDDSPPAARRELGKIHLNRGQPKEAVQALSTYIKAVSTDASAHYLLARAYRVVGDAAAAARHLDTYKRLSNRDAENVAMRKALQLFNREPPPD